jgi:hypothetical protein
MSLSKRGWNNVLIFACIGMIVIFNLMSEKLIENSEGDIVDIVPEQSMILTLEYPNVSVERLGTSWRVSPSDVLKPADVDRVINAWLALSGEVSLATSDEVGYRVTLWLAGQENPMKLWVQPESRLITNVLSQKTWKVGPLQLGGLTITKDQL